MTGNVQTTVATPPRKPKAGSRSHVHQPKTEKIKKTNRNTPKPGRHVPCRSRGRTSGAVSGSAGCVHNGDSRYMAS